MPGDGHRNFIDVLGNSRRNAAMSHLLAANPVVCVSPCCVPFSIDALLQDNRGRQSNVASRLNLPGLFVPLTLNDN